MGKPRLTPASSEAPAGNFLVDTCVLLWWAAAPKRLSRPARAALAGPGAAVFYSSISVAEVARLAEKGRIEIAEHWKPWLRRVLPALGWGEIPPGREIFEEAYSLPGAFHGDPADRVLVATARVYDLVLVTPDAQIRGYPHVTCFW